ncbi:F-box only protein 3-like [Mercenaria mercenaria]|uniref:F-box only protein 3-like n=1 Tax=Mercenaria mercenaria TaxID=6596 RepID=UPI00234F6258|nr:F-box only protein 3-like [Mercenaria mercenaria]
MLLSLPDESLLIILRFLHYKDINNVSCVNKRFQRLCKDDSLWKWQCSHYFLNSQCDKTETWYEHFVSLFSEYGRYTHYKEIRCAWDKIEKFLEKYCPTILASLQDGVSEGDLHAVEDHIQHKLPEDLRLSYRIHNGQNLLAQSPGLMGGCMISTHIRTDSLVPLEEMKNSYQTEGPLAGCAFLSLDQVCKAAQLITISGQGGFSEGYVYSFMHDPDRPSPDCFIMGSTFLEWLCDYANKLEQNSFYVAHEHIFKFYHEPGCVDGNIGITVKPTTCFIPELSRVYPPQHFFAYRIMIEMSEDTPPDQACQLKSRFWHIKDGDGKEEEVSGPGVVGEYPVMKPGAKFAWISCSTFETPTGEMKGSFKFRNLRTGIETDVPCPLFCMKAPACLTAAERREIIKARQKENG